MSKKTKIRQHQLSHKGRTQANGQPEIIIYNKVIFPPTPADDLFPESHIYGVDTESFNSHNQSELHTLLVQSASDSISEAHLSFESDEPFFRFFPQVFNRFSEDQKGNLSPSNTSLRRTPGKRGTGRRKIPEVLLCFYNLEYDIQRLFSPSCSLWDMLRLNIEGSRITIGDWEIENVRSMLTGSAPHFNWIFRHDNKILRVYALDLWGYLKEGLKASAKALGVIEKDYIDAEMFDKYLEDLTLEDIDQLIEYGKKDATIPRALYLKLVELLFPISASVIRRNGLLPPSAPGAAARMMFGGLKAPLIQPSKQTLQIARESYAGGMVFNVVKGEVEHANLFDRISAYPTMMTMLPDPEQTKIVVYKNEPIDSLISSFGFCYASFVNTSKTFPAVTIYNPFGGASGHAPGKYESLPISISELAIGYQLGFFQDIKIHEAHIMQAPESAYGTGCIADYIKRVYELKKSSPKDSPMYLMSKLLLNSPYGKLVELHKDESWIIPTLMKHLTIPSLALTDKDLKDKVMEMLRTQDVQELMELASKFPQEDLIPIRHLQSQQIKAGTYYLPVYGASVTAGQRAWMLAFTSSIDAILADTDSALTQLYLPEVEKGLASVTNLTLNARLGPCHIGTALGDVEHQIENASGYVAGIKQYFLEGTSNGKPKVKYARHTITKPNIPKDQHEDFYRQTIKFLATGEQPDTAIGIVNHTNEGETFTYQESASPQRLRTSLERGKDFGKFFSPDRTLQTKHDSRMTVADATAKENVKTLHYQWVSIDES